MINAVGYGEDLHELIEGRKLVLGGVTIPFEKGEKAHSDGDVVIHALIDAILGACALGDIGKIYPDTSEETKDMDSRVMLRETYQKMREKNFGVVNIDVTIILERPKLQDYIQDMRANISEMLHTDIKNVSIKAKTNEGMDAIGEGRAVKAVAIVLLSKLSFTL